MKELMSDFWYTYLRSPEDESRLRHSIKRFHEVSICGCDCDVATAAEWIATRIGADINASIMMIQSNVTLCLRQVLIFICAIHHSPAETNSRHLDGMINGGLHAK